VGVFVRLWISLPRIKLTASNFARWFIGVLGRESHILVNFAPPEAQNRTNRPARPCCNVMLLGFCDFPCLFTRHGDVGSACVDIRQSPKTDVLVRVCYQWRWCVLQPPRVGGLKVYIDNVRRNEVIMDIEIV